MINSYLLLFRSLELSLNLVLGFSGELILFFAFFNFLFNFVSLVVHLKQSYGAISCYPIAVSGPSYQLQFLLPREIFLIF